MPLRHRLATLTALGLAFAVLPMIAGCAGSATGEFATYDELDEADPAADVEAGAEDVEQAVDEADGAVNADTADALATAAAVETPIAARATYGERREIFLMTTSTKT